MNLKQQQWESLFEPRYLERGKDYAAQGLIRIVARDARQAEARATGTRLYTVRLRLERGKLSGECTCPAFADFGPCKHMAALCYSLIDNAYRESGLFHAREDQFLATERALRRMTKAQLIDLLLRIGGDDLDQWLDSQDDDDEA